MSERRVVGDLSIGKYSAVAEEKPPTLGVEISPEIRESIGDFSVSQQRVLDAGGEFLSGPDFLEKLKPDLEGLEKARNAEIFLETAIYFLSMKSIDFDLEKMEFPDLEDIDEEVEDISEYLANKDIATHRIFKAIINVMAMDLHNIEEIDGRQLGGVEAKDYINIYYNAFIRRVKYFKDCLRLVSQHNFTIEDLLEEQKKLRFWQLEQAPVAVPEQIPDSLRDFSPGVRRAIFNNTAFVELNEGCSVHCYFCGFDAPKDVKHTLSFEESAYLASHVINSDALFYKGTDPGDYIDPNDPSKTYADVLTVREAVVGSPVYVSTAYPAKSKDRILKMGDRIGRFSVGAMNRKRLGDDGLFRMFGKTGVPATADLQDGSFFGGTRAISHFFIKGFESGKPQGLNDLVDLLTSNRFGSAFSVRDKDHPDVFSISGRQRQVIIKKFGEDSLPEYSATIVCADGVTISPREVTNSVAMFSTDQFPNGEAVCKLDQNNLAVGSSEIYRIYIDWTHGAQKSITDFLPFGIVNYKYGSIALNEKHAKEKAKEAPFESLCNQVEINTYNADGRMENSWAIKYHQVDGRIIDVIKVHKQ